MELYFFSALLQADAAILGILGVFIVFRLQVLQNNIYYLRNILLDRVTPAGTAKRNAHYLVDINNFDEYNLKEKEKDLKRIHGENKYYFEQWFEKEKEIVSLKYLIRLPIVLLVIGLIMNMVFLSLAETKIGIKGWIFLIIIYHIFLFIKIVQLIFKTISSGKGA